MSRNKKLTEKQRNRYYHFMIYEDVDSCLLRLFESFLEAAPQLSWQLYIAMVLKESEDAIGSKFAFHKIYYNYKETYIEVYDTSFKNEILIMIIYVYHFSSHSLKTLLNAFV